MIHDTIIRSETFSHFSLVVDAQSFDHLLLVVPVEVVDDIRCHEFVDLSR